MPRIALPEGVSIHCAVDDYLWPWDESTPVLMMHGFARNASFWSGWIPAIADTHRVYRPDLLGCGLSDQPPHEYHYTPASIGAQIIAVLDALSLSRVHWVGESSGGLIGLLLAAAHPNRIASLVVCNTPSRIPDRIRRIYALDCADAGAAMLAHGTGEWCRQTLGYRLDLEHADAALQDWVVQEMDRTLPAVAAAMHHCFEDVDTIDILAKIPGPADQWRQEPDFVGSAEGVRGQVAEWPTRGVCRVRSWRQSSVARKMRARRPGVLEFLNVRRQRLASCR